MKAKLALEKRKLWQKYFVTSGLFLLLVYVATQLPTIWPTDVSWPPSIVFVATYFLVVVYLTFSWWPRIAFLQQRKRECGPISQEVKNTSKTRAIVFAASTFVTSLFLDWTHIFHLLLSAPEMNVVITSLIIAASFVSILSDVMIYRRC